MPKRTRTYKFRSKYPVPNEDYRPLKRNWLDMLPADVCDNVAEFTTAGKRTVPAMNLAQVSYKQRQAVIQAMSNELSLNRMDEKFTSEYENTCDRIWGEIFMNCVGKLYLHDTRTACKVRKTLIRSPTLEYASVASKSWLRIVCNSSSIRELKLWVGDLLSRDLDFLFSSLKEMNLKKLVLYCGEYGATLACMYENRRFFNDSRNAIAEVCPGLTCIEIMCRCNATYPIWKILPKLPNVNEVLINNVPPPHLLTRIRNMKSVKIEEAKSDYIEAARVVGNSVTELRGCTEDVLYRSARFTQHNLWILDKCPRLKTLHIDIERGLESSLPGALAHTVELENLHIRWNYGLFKPDKGVLIALLKNKPRMKDLSLTNAELDLEEILEVIRKLGTHLEYLRLQIDFGSQLSTTMEGIGRLEHMLCTLANSCRNIKQFKFSPASLPYEHIRSVPPASRRRMRAIYHHLKSRAPFIQIAPELRPIL